MPANSLSATDFASPDSPTSGIQEAVDALGRDGGIVRLPAGQYPLRCSIQLRSNVTLSGEGPATVLVRARRPVSCPLAEASDGSRKSVRLARTRGLHVGDQVYIGDDDNYGWWATHAIVKSIDDGRLGLDVLHGERRYRYRPGRGARLWTWFPAIWLRDSDDVTVRSLTIDGAIARHTRKRCDFVVAAVHTRNCGRVRVLDVSVRNWPGDGIGIQGGRGSRVSGCIVENCAGHGLHPGTSITESIWNDNIARGNTRDGLFFCLRVTHSAVRGNILTHNAGHGIGGLTDPDGHNVVDGNVCAHNGGHGIDAERAVGNVITGNLCRNNSQSGAGRFAGIYLAHHRDCVVTGNACIDDQDEPTQTRPLVDVDAGGGNVVRDNHLTP